MFTDSNDCVPVSFFNEFEYANQINIYKITFIQQGSSTAYSKQEFNFIQSGSFRPNRVKYYLHNNCWYIVLHFWKPRIIKLPISICSNTTVLLRMFGSHFYVDFLFVALFMKLLITFIDPLSRETIFRININHIKASATAWSCILQVALFMIFTAIVDAPFSR